MASHREVSVCERCGTRYVKCRYNKYNQKYCTRAVCVLDRRRERQRQRYRKRYRNDRKFAASERQRCREGIRKRRLQTKPATDAKMKEDTLEKINIMFLTTGLLSQWIDSKDPEIVEQAARQLEQRGQQLASAGTTSRGSPIF